MDQTGKFPQKSNRVNKYVTVLIEMDSDAILVEAMKNRNSGEMVRVYQKLVDRLKAYGVAPNHHVLDNECSKEFKEAIRSNGMTFQLADAHDHRRNVAEKAIQVFKAHFISILCGTDENFPMHLWDRLLEQAEHTLNMLRPSRVVPKVSAFAYLNGEHNYNQQPFALLGCKVEMHVMPAVRESWAAHTATGYYIGTSWEHYRNHKVYIKDTRSVRTGATVFFKHKYLTMPTVTTSDALIKAAEDMSQAVKGSFQRVNRPKKLLSN